MTRTARAWAAGVTAAVLLAAPVAAGDGTTAALWRDEAVLDLVTVPVGPAGVDLDPKPDFRGEEADGYRYVPSNFTPNSVTNPAGWVLTASLAEGTVNRLTLRLPPTWDMQRYLGGGYIGYTLVAGGTAVGSGGHYTVVGGTPVPLAAPAAPGAGFEHVLHVVPYGAPTDGPAPTVALSQDGRLSLWLSLTRGPGGGNLEVRISPTTLTATLERDVTGPLPTTASVDVPVPGFAHPSLVGLAPAVAADSQAGAGAGTGPAELPGAPTAPAGPEAPPVAPAPPGPAADADHGADTDPAADTDTASDPGADADHGADTDPASDPDPAADTDPTHPDGPRPVTHATRPTEEEVTP